MAGLGQCKHPPKYCPVVMVLAGTDPCFLCRGLCGALFWICDENSGDGSTLMFQLSLSSGVQRQKFLLCCPASKESKELGASHSQDS